VTTFRERSWSGDAKITLVISGASGVLVPVEYFCDGAITFWDRSCPGQGSTVLVIAALFAQAYLEDLLSTRLVSVVMAVQILPETCERMKSIRSFTLWCNLLYK
jgi:hypothetical protein